MRGLTRPASFGPGAVRWPLEKGNYGEGEHSRRGGQTAAGDVGVARNREDNFLQERSSNGLQSCCGNSAIETSI